MRRTLLAMIDEDRPPEVSEDVARLIAVAEKAPTTDEIVDALKSKYSEEAVLGALEHLHREIDTEKGFDQRWYWRGPPVTP